MLKLISVNIEKNRHYNTVLPFLDEENADVVCLQEVPEEFSRELGKLGYKTSFAPMSIDDIDTTIGIMFASKLPYNSKTVYYHGSADTVVKYGESRKDKTGSNAYILATVSTLENNFLIATTHMTDTKDGHEDYFQTKCTANLLDALSKEKPHLICGDFNMPRGYNSLYEKMTATYTDNIPPKYKSSLDKNLHRLGDKVVDQPIFDEYMVDYIFTQPPYKAKDVRLEFGISDHAAVIATITNEK